MRIGARTTPRCAHVHTKFEAAKTDSQGYLWFVYDGEPPIYEVAIWKQNGWGISIMVEADELELITDPKCIQIPDEALEFWKCMGGSIASTE